jgi:hypothetical protein
MSMVPPATVTLAVAAGLGKTACGCAEAAPIWAVSAVAATASSATEASMASGRKQGMRGCEG